MISKISKTLLMLLLASGMFLSCSDNDDPAVADFDLSVSGESPNAVVTITNNSQNVSSFSWEFSEGASISTSSASSPAAITVDKAGNFTVTLTADGKITEKSVTIAGNNGIVTYDDVEFGMPGSSSIGMFFSTASGVMYMESQLDATNGPTIDLIYDNNGSPVNFFASPDDDDYDVSGGTSTKITNYVTDEFDVNDFDTMSDDSLIKDLTVEDDEESFPSNYEGVVLFENAAGKKGVIKVVAINSERVLVDIKVQKY